MNNSTALQLNRFCNIWREFKEVRNISSKGNPFSFYSAESGCKLYDNADIMSLYALKTNVKLTNSLSNFITKKLYGYK